MYIRIDEEYEDLLKRLAERHKEPTATGMVRALIRDAAKASGDWDALEECEPILEKVSNGNG